MDLIFDIEANGLLQDATRVHCIVTRDPQNNVRRYHDCPEIPSDGPLEWGLDALSQADRIIGHNVDGYDVPLLQKFWPQWKPTATRDTLVMSRLMWPELKPYDFKRHKDGNLPGQLIGRHSLEAWGYRLKVYKGDFAKKTDWAEFSPEMLEYCVQDTEATKALLSLEMSQSIPEETVDVEHQFAQALFGMEQRGFNFNLPLAEEFAKRLMGERAELGDKLRRAFDGWTDIYFTPKKKLRREKFTRFNPGSRQHVARYLKEHFGWVPTEFTPKGSPEVSEETLAAIGDPLADEMARFLTIRKRLGLLCEGKRSLMKNIGPDGRVHGGAIHNGAVTGRCRHYIIVNIPKPYVTYGETFRQLFVASPGNKLVGVDASGLEMRCLAHYMLPFGGQQFADAVVSGSKEDGTDAHTLNQKAAGLSSRDEAKTFFYALIYGAGDKKIGSIVGGTAKDGKALKRKFFKNMPAFGRLKRAVEEQVGEKGYLRGLDGRRLQIRKQHAAVNTLLQSAGAIVMKRATVLLEKSKVAGHLVAHQHDEYQLDVPSSLAAEAAGIGRRSISEAGEWLNFRVPLDGEAQIGYNWSETH